MAFYKAGTEVAATNYANADNISSGTLSATLKSAGIWTYGGLLGGVPASGNYEFDTTPTSIPGAQNVGSGITVAENKITVNTAGVYLFMAQGLYDPQASTQPNWYGYTYLGWAKNGTSTSSRVSGWWHSNHKNTTASGDWEYNHDFIMFLVDDADQNDYYCLCSGADNVTHHGGTHSNWGAVYLGAGA
jgi:hypothetical protein|tara:strand:+ start:38 stop:601 length:564 start_codon:yes stop_codon:yes gene_type:complete